MADHEERREIGREIYVLNHFRIRCGPGRIIGNATWYPIFNAADLWIEPRDEAHKEYGSAYIGSNDVYSSMS